MKPVKNHIDAINFDSVESWTKIRVFRDDGYFLGERAKKRHADPHFSLDVSGMEGRDTQGMTC